jgi:hypothetical protein
LLGLGCGRTGFDPPEQPANVTPRDGGAKVDGGVRAPDARDAGADAELAGDAGATCRAQASTCAGGHCQACRPLVSPPPHTALVPTSRSMAAGDLNHDGRPDLVTEFSGIYDLLNDGAGGLLPASVIEADDYFDGNVAVGDVDEDGAPDLIAARVWDQSLDPVTGGLSQPLGTALRFGRGDGTFGPWQIVEMNYQRVALGDLNEDGHLDLVGSPYVGPLEVRFGAGDGSFGAPVSLVGADVQVCGCLALMVADVDGDSHLDLVADLVTVLLGDGTGHIARVLPPQLLANNSGADIISASVGDLDGDGHPDLALGYQFGSRVSTFRGNGDGTFTPLQDLTLGPSNHGYGVYATGVVDLDGDGRGQLLVLESDRSTLEIFATGTDGRVANPATLPIANTFTLRLVDADGDGDLDVVAVSPPALQVHLNRGDGSFVTGPPIGTGSCPALSALAGDVDEDGVSDLLLLGSCNQIVLGTRDGNFSGARANLDVSYGTPLTLVDVDADGHLDLVSYIYDASSAQYPLLVARGDGHGGFGQPSQVMALAQSPLSPVAVTDFNRDCHPDLVLELSSGAGTVLLLSGPDGRLRAATLPDIGGSFLSVPVTGDFNGDHNPDLAFTHYVATADGDTALHVLVLPGDGEGNFGRVVDTRVPDIAAMDAFFTSTAAADSDGDGVDDLVIGRFLRQSGVVTAFETHVLRGVGDGTFAPWITPLTISDSPGGFGLGDLNGDGRPDIAVVGYNGGELTVAATCR